MNGDMGRFWDMAITRQWLKIDAPAGFFPLAVTCVFQTAPSAEFRRGIGFVRGICCTRFILILMFP